METGFGSKAYMYHPLHVVSRMTSTELSKASIPSLAWPWGGGVICSSRSHAQLWGHTHFTTAGVHAHYKSVVETEYYSIQTTTAIPT